MGFRFILQNGQKKGCRDSSQLPTNADEIDENGRRKVYSFTLENEKGMCFRLGITKLRGNRKVIFLY